MSNSLQVILAGHNGDVESLCWRCTSFTPETLSAAYARISRFADPVPELRRKAREEVNKARKSNQAIVFGMGHHSVAEHAVLNFDILGLSRLAIEALEWHRLCSYTEKSQRYITLDGDFMIPTELNAEERERFVATIEMQNQGYALLLPKLLEYQIGRRLKHSKRKALEGKAKEDARYVVALATTGQLGFTSNARNLELIIRRMRHHRLYELSALSGLLFLEASKVAPSLIILADERAFEEAHGVKLRDDFFRCAGSDLASAVADVEVTTKLGEWVPPQHSLGNVTLMNMTSDPDAAVISGLLFTAGKGTLAECYWAAARLPNDQRRQLVAQALAHLSEHDCVPRAFEEASFRFEIVLDASALAQLKRHRMSTQHWGSYDPDLGSTVPPAVEEAGEIDAFSGIMDQTNETYRWLRQSLEQRGESAEAATYVLTNAHRRRVSLTMNLRELYHFSRLREDHHAQWAIRQIATNMSLLVRRVAPATAQLLGGKDTFAASRL